MTMTENNEIQNTGELMSGPITAAEIETARFCITYGMSAGASQMRVSLSKSILDSFTVLNGRLDKVMHSADRSLFLYIFADGKYGTFSTNDFSETRLKEFISKALDTVKMLAPDQCRRLPAKERKTAEAVTGQELHLFDPGYLSLTPEAKLQKAMNSSIFKSLEPDSRYTVISEECEYSDSVDDNCVLDSEGFMGRHTETSFAICSEMTVQDASGRKTSGYWWDSSPFCNTLAIDGCSMTALSKAIEKIGPKRHRGGTFRMVVDRSVSSRLVSPLLSALNGAAIQQKNSFLDGSLGKKIFSERLTITDLATTSGKPGARLFDTEGTATSDRPVIKNGVVSMYFINTYIAEKTGFSPTIEGVSRPVVAPFFPGSMPEGDADSCLSEEFEINLPRILKLCGSGIYVTGFNGGNCNPTTGDFSYGVEGFAFRDGKITHPIREMVVTGNMITLWNGILAAGTDARPCTRWQIPTLAFNAADFSA